MQFKRTKHSHLDSLNPESIYLYKNVLNMQIQGHLNSIKSYFCQIFQIELPSWNYVLHEALLSCKRLRCYTFLTPSVYCVFLFKHAVSSPDFGNFRFLL